MSDGKIEFDVKIDTTGFDQYSKTLDKMRKKAENHQKRLNELDKEIAKNRRTIKEPHASDELKAKSKENLMALVEESAKLGEEFEDLNAKISQAEPFEEYAKKGKKAIQKLNSEVEKQKLNIQSGINPDTASFEKSKIIIQKLRDEASQYAQEMAKGMPDLGNSLKENIDNIANSQLENAETYKSGEIKRKELEKSQKQAEREIEKTSKLLQKELLKDARLKEKEMQRLARVKEKEIAKNAELERKENERIAREKEKRSNAGVAKAVTKKLTGIASLFKTRIRRMMITAVINGFSAGMSAFMQQSKEAKTAMQNIQTSWSTLCNAMGSAFGQLLPIVSTVFSGIIDWITTGMNALAKFIALLSGKSSYKKAIKSNKALGKAVGGVGKQAKETAEEEKKSLASFDEINQLNISDKTNDDSAGGGGGAGAGLSDDLYETVPITTELSDRLKAIIEEFKRLGNLFKEGFFDGLGDNWRTTADGIKQDCISIGQTLKRIFTDPAVTTAMNDLKETWAYNLGLAVGSFAKIGLNLGAGLIGGIESYITSSEELLTTALTETLESIAGIMEWSGIASVALATISEAFGSEWCQQLIGNIYTMLIDPIVVGFSLLVQLLESLMQLIIAPIASNAELIKQILMGLFQAFTEFLTPVIEPIKEFGEWMLTAYDEYVSPFVDQITEALTLVFEEYLQNIIDVKLPAFITALRFVGTQLGKILGHVLSNIKTVIKMVFTILHGLMEFILGVFTGDWERAWDGIKEIFKGVWNGIVELLESAVDYIVDCLNSLDFDVPDWVPLIGGTHFGFDISPVSIPRLATGTVVPPNAGEFMAVLGDNKRETEVVSPLSTMKQALSEALAENGGGSNNITIKFNGDLAELARILKPEIEAENRRVGMDLVVE